MKQAVLLGIAALASCTSKPQATCPSIEALVHRDAIADARAALARGDRHLLMLGGYVGSVPGVKNWAGYQLQEIEGTSDTTSEACRRLGATAEAYAAKYNHAIIAGTTSSAAAMPPSNASINDARFRRKVGRYGTLNWNGQVVNEATLRDYLGKFSAMPKGAGSLSAKFEPSTPTRIKDLVRGDVAGSGLCRQGRCIEVKWGTPTPVVH
jgi:hypothetical protein